MKGHWLLIAALALVLSAAIGATAGWAEGEEDYTDRTLSPYFFVKSDDPSLDQLPLKSTSAVVNIAGVIADVRVTQVYANEGQQNLEAIYVFPASTRAAVYGMRMQIGQRVIVAEIREREQARQEYEEAKEQGQSASLLEQERPNVFQMSVANIMPGDTISVELRYTELLVPTEGVYEFVYPTVVGPRYSEEPASSGQGWIETPYQHEGESPTYTFDMTVNLATGLGIDQIACSSHMVQVAYESPSLARVTLGESERYGGNRDYILRYRLAGNQIESGLLLYEGEAENFFLLMVQPPKAVLPDQVSPREYIFIVDVSGSMHGFPLDISKELLRDLIGNLRPTDRFNVLLFASGSAVLSDASLPATAENVARAIQVIEQQAGGGGTRLLPALQRALELPRAGEGYARSIVIATDGYVTVETEVFDLMRERLGDANMFAFGIGSSVNRHIIEGMARVGMGEAFVITKAEDAAAQAAKFRQYVETPVLTGVEMDFGAFEAYDIEPPSVPDVLAERPVIVFGKWVGQAQGQITVGGQAAGGAYRVNLDVGDATLLETNAALRYLWARHRIALRQDYERINASEALTQEITELGLTYSLLTAYTSFVAIDKVVRADGSEVTTVEQPLPLPQGVSDYAVGDAAYTGVGSFGAPQSDGRGVYPASPSEETDKSSGVSWLGKTFCLKDGVWTEEAYQEGAQIELYTGSSEQPSILAQFAALGRPMIVVVNGQAYGIEGTATHVWPCLGQNVPNPFNASTVIRFSLPPEYAGADVRVVVYDLAGQMVRVLTAGPADAGSHRVSWDGKDERGLQIGSGVYAYRLEAGKVTVSRRMLLLR